MTIPSRKTLVRIQQISLGTATISLFVVLFLVGDTDFGPEAPPPPITFILTGLGGSAALIAGLIHIVGLPPEQKEKKSGSRRGRRRSE